MAALHLLLAFFQIGSVFVSFTYGFDHTISREEVEERECVGTANGFSGSGTLEFQYNHLRKRYAGCTYVLGNLEITHLSEPRISYDLSFLKHIRYVSGYVLIGLTGEVNEIPLLNLEIIRGNQTFSIQGEEYSLMVALTSSSFEDSPSNGLTTLKMPKLKEISSGKAIFIHNPSLGYIDTIDWDPIMKGRLDSIHFGKQPYNQSLSNRTDPDLCNGGGMWGNEEALCQEIVPSPICDYMCDSSLCFGPGPSECCHDTCAIGCLGPAASDCMTCKDFKFLDKCVSYCPPLSYQLMQQCIEYTPLNPL